MNRVEVANWQEAIALSLEWEGPGYLSVRTPGWDFTIGPRRFAATDIREIADSPAGIGLGQPQQCVERAS